jgi:hypothetical protein
MRRSHRAAATAYSAQEINAHTSTHTHPHLIAITDSIRGDNAETPLRVRGGERASHFRRLCVREAHETATQSANTHLRHR